MKPQNVFDAMFVLLIIEEEKTDKQKKPHKYTNRLTEMRTNRHTIGDIGMADKKDNCKKKKGKRKREEMSSYIERRHN